MQQPAPSNTGAHIDSCGVEGVPIAIYDLDLGASVGTVSS